MTTKADKILELVMSGESLSRKQIAERVGCTPQRVGEVLRANDLAASVVTPKQSHASAKRGLESRAAKTPEPEPAPAEPAPDGGYVTSDGTVGTARDAKEVHKYVMATLLEGGNVTDEDFEIASQYARVRKTKRPARAG